VRTEIGAGPGPRCNIGPAEIQRRRWVAGTLTVAVVVVAVGLLAAGVSPLTRAILWPVAAGAAISWLQVVNRFCVRFGIGGLENFGAMGAERKVARQQLAEDQRRALLLIGQGMLIGLLVTVAFVNLPL
jgi:hypothetical protein